MSNFVSPEDWPEGLLREPFEEPYGPDWDDLTPAEPRHPPRPSRLETTDLAALFGPEGALAATLEGYEQRPSQVQMAEAVKQAILERRTAIIEAPTGTGKSIAYLLPAILSGRTVVVATANKSLQNQLYTKDIPFLSQVLGEKIDAVVVKGRSNYICTYKWEQEEPIRRQMAFYEGQEDEQINHLRTWIEETETGDVDDLPFMLPGDLRPKIVSYPDDCLHRDCRHYYERCFVNWMRERARDAQVIITNHHLLLNALELGEVGKALLPEASIYVIDEAHGLEATATAVFDVEVSDFTLPQLLGRAVFKQHVDEDRLDELRFQNSLAFSELERLGDGNIFRLEEDLEEFKRLATNLTALLDDLRRANPYAQEEEKKGGKKKEESAEEAEARAAYEQALSTLSGLIEKLKQVASSKHDGQVVRYVERVYSRQVRMRVHAAPVDPSPLLRKYLFDEKERTVICTSATLATNGHFGLFRSRCGVDEDPIELIVDPVFDYPRQALLYQPSLPSYNWRAKERYYDAVAGEIERLLEVSRGRALCLFTNWSGLQQVQERL
ncbi:MAG: ATP-dependent DNA helicase, partial [Caldilineae bacterium]